MKVAPCLEVDSAACGFGIAHSLNGIQRPGFPFKPTSSACLWLGAAKLLRKTPCAEEHFCEEFRVCGRWCEWLHRVPVLEPFDVCSLCCLYGQDFILVKRFV